MSESAGQPPLASTSLEDPLVLAMPRKELFRINGFVTTIDMAIIEAVAEDSWYGAASTLINNFDAKEVRLGLVVCQGDQVLIDEGGNLLHTTRIGPEVAKLGKGLKALRDLARLAGAHFLGVDSVRCELAGFLNEDALAEHRHAFYMVYRCRIGEPVAPPHGMTWVGVQHLVSMPLDPVSIVVTGGLFPPAGHG